MCISVSYTDIPQIECVIGQFDYYQNIIRFVLPDLSSSHRFSFYLLHFSLSIETTMEAKEGGDHLESAQEASFFWELLVHPL